MAFASVNFILLVAASLLVYRILPEKHRWLALLAASMAFYIAGGVWGLIYLAATTVTTYLAGIIIARVIAVPCPEGTDKKAHRQAVKRRRHLIVGAVCVFNFAMLFVLKYWDFTAESVNGALGTTLPTFDLVMPLGLSFYIFQSIGYVVDVSRGKVQAEKNILRYALFTSFFPQMVQGPIGRYGDLAPQLMAGDDLDSDNLRDGIQLCMYGYFKKLVIAERCSAFVSAVFSSGDGYPGAAAALAALLYCIQLYCDFSGGIDISRGVATMFGIELAENFRRPIFAVSLTDFWRRWHMSLGSWLKDYLFYPLSLSSAFTKLGRFARKRIPGTLGKIFPTTLATFIIYFVIGIWHGANYTYIAYGLYNGFIITGSLLLEPTFRKWREKLPFRKDSLFWYGFRMLRTSLIVYFGRFITRAPWLKMGVLMIWHAVTDFHPSVLTWEYMASLGLSGLDIGVIAVGILFVLFIEYLQETGTRVRTWLSDQEAKVQFLAIIIPLLIILLFGVAGRDHVGSSFIYAQF